MHFFFGKRTAAFAQHALNGIQDGIDPRVSNMIKDIPAIAPVLNQTRFAQDRQLLRDIRLAKAKMSFHMANAVFAIAQDG